MDIITLLYNNSTISSTVTLLMKIVYLLIITITSMIQITPASLYAITGYIFIVDSTFCNNNHAHFLNLESDRDNVW